MDVVGLTDTRDRFGSQSQVLSAVSRGWPAVSSTLKTLLETSPLPPST